MCGFYEDGDGVEMARDERCREHADGIAVGRCERAVSMQAHIE